MLSNLGYGMSMGGIESAMGWDCEPIIEDVTDSLGNPYHCEADDCDQIAVAELSWPMEDHNLPSGFFCQFHLDGALKK